MPCAEIRPGDLVLIDMWAKLDQPDSVYYDITWVGFCGTPARPPRCERVFDHRPRRARSRHPARAGRRRGGGATTRISKWTTPRAEYIRGEGFGEYFFHRTGHSIGAEVHGTGANMDNLETHDERRVIPWTCFSIEPGIYLPKFGIRSEVNVFVGDGNARVTGEIQQKLVLIG